MVDNNRRSWNKRGEPEYYIPRDYRFIAESGQTCKKSDGNPAPVEIVVAVISSLHNADRRQRVRQTWGREFKNGANARVLFFLGVDKDNGTRSAIRNESLTYHDIVQHSHWDSYDNLSIKSVSVIRWVTSYCRHASYVFKVDDDALVNAPHLMSRLHMASKQTKYFLMCYVFKGSPVVRDPNHRWYISKQEYGGKSLPPYCGGFYAIVGKLVPVLYDTAIKQRLFRMEDVFISSMVARRTGLPVRLVHNKAFSLWKAVSLKKPCDFRKQIAVTNYNQSEIRALWDSYKAKCS
ncbi:beta-1,3-galactosyltransferase 1-like [Lineus longissimus]|uniref:beta-1,3-galactosyltransferase 1-like n=1 Tax=Lineus longissimus TaxID=88925 RepID=UPI00315DC4BD